MEATDSITFFCKWIGFSMLAIFDPTREQVSNVMRSLGLTEGKDIPSVLTNTE